MLLRLLFCDTCEHHIRCYTFHNVDANSSSRSGSTTLEFGHAFDEWQSFSAEVLTKCPACKKKKLQRLFGSGAAILFKGSGFYITDYKKKSGSPDGAKTPAKSPETKPAAPAAAAK